MHETTDYTTIEGNLKLIRERIQNASLKAGRDPATVRLLLATKTVPAARVKMALDLGETLTGENKVQEIKEKAPVLDGTLIERHFIGHLQTNKIREVLKYVNCIQSVDRIELVEKLNARLRIAQKSIGVFVQVNTSFEDSKFGVHPDQALALIEQVRSYVTLQVKGLMTIGLFDADPLRVRPSFRLLREIRDEAVSRGLMDAAQAGLSMGMSGDLETAIEEGATIVRVGTAIFGKRQYPDSYYWNENK